MAADYWIPPNKKLELLWNIFEKNEEWHINKELIILGGYFFCIKRNRELLFQLINPFSFLSNLKVIRQFKLYVLFKPYSIQNTGLHLCIVSTQAN